MTAPTKTPIKARAGKGSPCQVCGEATKGCSVTVDGLHLCRGTPGKGWARLTTETDPAGYHHYRAAGEVSGRSTSWADRARQYAEAMTDARRRQLAKALRLPVDSLQAIAIGTLRDSGGDCWTFPEVDAGGNAVGITRRYADGSKKAMSGSTRGLTVPAGWSGSAGSILLPEGASDVLALSRCGLVAIGRPSNTGGVDMLTQLLDDVDEDRSVFFVGENDKKPDGSWPGRDGVERSARRLADTLQKTVYTAFPPEGLKDCRSWVHEILDGQGEAEDWELIGREILAHVEATAEAVVPSASLTAESKGAGADEWEDPIPLDDSANAPPPFPLHCFPARLADLCRDIGETIGCPPDYAAAFALATAAGTAGASVALNVKPDWTEHASLYICAVAPPNGGKTPSFKLVTRPVIDEQCERIAAGNKKPAYVGDVTVEKLGEILKDDPRGTLLLRDELAGWIKGMDQYKSKGGSDRQFWLSVWSSDAVSVSRKNPDSPHVFIPHPCVSIVGGIQPEVLGSLRGNDDGFFDRLLFTFPQTLPAKGEDWRSCKPGLIRAWSAALGVIRSIEMESKNDRPACPQFVTLSPGARLCWENFTSQLARRINDPEFPRHIAGVAGKLKGYGARLALVAMLLRVAYDPSVAIENLTAQDMAAGAELALYFLAHAERVYQGMGRDTGAVQAAKVLTWVRANGQAAFSRRDVHRCLRVTFPQPEQLAEPLSRLVQHGYLRYAQTAPEPAGKKPTGRKPTTTYEVHPSILEQRDKSDKSDKRVR